MKLNAIIYVLVICVMLIGLFVFGYATRGGTTATVQGVSGNADKKSLLSTSEILYDFGTISMKNGLVNKEFTISNPTDKDITIGTVLTSCMCTAAYIVRADGSISGPFKMPGMGYVPPANELIKAGDNRIIRAVYDPNAHGPAGVGKIDRFITLTDTTGGTIRLEIKAVVTP